MFEKLFASRKGAEAKKPRVPDDTRVYAIGDIHGRLDLLQKLHGLIVEDARDFSGRRKVLVYLGDYIDRRAASGLVAHVADVARVPGPDLGRGAQRVGLGEIQDRHARAALGEQARRGPPDAVGRAGAGDDRGPVL